MTRIPALNSPFLLGFDDIERALDRVRVDGLVVTHVPLAESDKQRGRHHHQPDQKKRNRQLAHVHGDQHHGQNDDAHDFRDHVLPL